LETAVSKIHSAWKKYIETGECSAADISQTIVRSWKRCLQLKINPFQVVVRCLSVGEMKIKIQENIKLIDVATPFMQKIYQFVAGSGFVVILLDRDGYILEVVGDKETLQKYPYLRRGENWGEEFKGTNAMGTVLIEKRPLQVYATEHFCEMNQSLTCSAAPIYSPQGEIIGILDLSGDFRKAHVHTLGMVVAAVGAIENQLGLEQASEEVLRAYEHLNAIVESMSEGLVSFDKVGNITRINSFAGKILGISAKECIGKNLGEVFATNEFNNYFLKQGKNINDYEMVLDTKRGRLHFTTSGRVIQGRSGETVGGVMTIREIKSVRKLVTRMLGAQARFTFADIIGTSKPMGETIRFAKKIAQGNSSVLLCGESGTGKEMFAQAIHNQSSFSEGPFMAINCAAIPRELIESELFGYEEGAFTGAKRGGRPGKFELANGGTIFLDEIGDMPLDTQVNLLRVLQEKQIIRVGGAKPIPVESRIIAATNKDLAREVEKGNFRLDLYYRLNVIALTIPPLRERREDILMLARYLVKKLGRPLGKEDLQLSPKVEKALMNYSWYGNVRELENAIERSVNIAGGGRILLEHLPEKIRKVNKIHICKEMEIVSIKEAEKRHIINALRLFNGNIARTAKTLGIGRNTLYRKIDYFEIDVEHVLENMLSSHVTPK
jgi:PAS domain S-box-containing protein